MQSTPLRDFIVGLFVLGGLLAVGYLSFSLGGGAYGGGGMELIAKTQAIGSLSERSPVTISGVRIGQVKAIRLNPDDYDAELTLEVDPSYELPIDTTAAIRTAGLLGDQFVALEPGAEDELLKHGDTLLFTEPALNIEKLVGSLVHGADLGGE